MSRSYIQNHEWSSRYNRCNKKKMIRRKKVEKNVIRLEKGKRSFAVEEETAHKEEQSKNKQENRQAKELRAE